MEIIEQAKIHEKINQLKGVASFLREGIIICDKDNRILWVNPSFNRITGYETEEVIGLNPRILGSGKQDRFFFETLWGDLFSTGHWKGTIWNKKKSGEIFQQILSLYAISDEFGIPQLFFGVFYEVQELVENSHDLLDNMRSYDLLTFLPNRNKLVEDIQDETDKDIKSAFFFLNIDRFKSINETLGHFAGDALLILFAQRLKKNFSNKLKIYRLSGDEFVILTKKFFHQSDLRIIAEEILRIISIPFLVNGEKIRITASIGISVSSKREPDFETVMKQADIALRHAKQKGNNNYSIYSHSFAETTLRRIQMEKKLPFVIDNDELTINFQPQVHIESGKLIGLEALIRWKNPKLGIVPPSEFIGLAEKNGSIIFIGEWVLRQSILQKKELDAFLPKKIKLSVNVSAVQLYDPHFLTKVKKILKETNYAPNQLTLEITETSMVQNMQKCIRVLNELKYLGINISLDDFGVGYSSLNHLKHFPLDCVKIDRSFICGIELDRVNYSIVKSIIELSNVKGMQVIAEGIEHREEAHILSKLGCDFGQGYLYSRPITKEECIERYAKTPTYK